jgi:hypothetical protein
MLPNVLLQSSDCRQYPRNTGGESLTTLLTLMTFHVVLNHVDLLEIESAYGSSLWSGASGPWATGV